MDNLPRTMLLGVAICLGPITQMLAGAIDPSAQQSPSDQSESRPEFSGDASHGRTRGGVGADSLAQSDARKGTNSTSGLPERKRPASGGASTPPSATWLGQDGHDLVRHASTLGGNDVQ